MKIGKWIFAAVALAAAIALVGCPSPTRVGGGDPGGPITLSLVGADPAGVAVSGTRQIQAVFGGGFSPAATAILTWEVLGVFAAATGGTAITPAPTGVSIGGPFDGANHRRATLTAGPNVEAGQFIRVRAVYGTAPNLVVSNTLAVPVLAAATGADPSITLAATSATVEVGGTQAITAAFANLTPATATNLVWTIVSVLDDDGDPVDPHGVTLGGFTGDNQRNAVLTAGTTVGVDYVITVRATYGTGAAAIYGEIEITVVAAGTTPTELIVPIASVVVSLEGTGGVTGTGQGPFEFDNNNGSGLLRILFAGADFTGWDTFDYVSFTFNVALLPPSTPIPGTEPDQPNFTVQQYTGWGGIGTGMHVSISSSPYVITVPVADLSGNGIGFQFNNSPATRPEEWTATITQVRFHD